MASHHYIAISRPIVSFSWGEALGMVLQDGGHNDQSEMFVNWNQ